MPIIVQPSAITRTAGTHPATHIEWVFISIEGRRLPASDATPPLLTAQCSRMPNGKFKFELLATDPAATTSPEPVFQPPWQPSPGVLFPPSLIRINVTMDFLGYTHVKPVKRQWEHPDGTTGILRYAAPSRISSNMEEIAFYLQYLRALPTLRLTLSTGKGEEFDTTAFQQAVRADPLCRASSL